MAASQAMSVGLPWRLQLPAHAGVVAPRLAVFGCLALASLFSHALLLERESFWRDEVDAVLFASVSWTDLVRGFTIPQHNGPAYHVLLRLWIELTGTTEYAVRYSSAMANVLALCLIGALGRRLGSVRVGVVAALLWSAMPSTHWYAREAKMYALLTVVAAACLYLALASVEDWPGQVRQTRRLAWTAAVPPAAWAAALALVGFYLHFFALLLVLPLLAVLLAVPRLRQSRRQVFVAAAATTLVIGALVVILLREVSTLTVPPWTGHPFVPLADLPRRVLFGIVLNTPPLGGLVPAILLLFPLLSGVLPLWRERRAQTIRRVGVLAGFALLPLSAHYLVSLHLPLFAERYFLVLLPALVLLQARGLVSLMERYRPLGIAACALLLALLASNAAAQATLDSRADYRSLAAYIRRESLPGDAVMVVMPYNARSVHFYAGDALSRVAAPTGLAQAASLEMMVGPTLDRHERLWLVRAEAEQHDPKGVIFEWLAGRSRIADSRQWTGLQLELFAKVP